MTFVSDNQFLSYGNTPSWFNRWADFEPTEEQGRFGLLGCTSDIKHPFTLNPLSTPFILPHTMEPSCQALYPFFQISQELLSIVVIYLDRASFEGMFVISRLADKYRDFIESPMDENTRMEFWRSGGHPLFWNMDEFMAEVLPNAESKAVDEQKKLHTGAKPRKVEYSAYKILEQLPCSGRNPRTTSMEPHDFFESFFGPIRGIYHFLVCVVGYTVEQMEEIKCLDEIGQILSDGTIVTPTMRNVVLASAFGLNQLASELFSQYEVPIGKSLFDEYSELYFALRAKVRESLADYNYEARFVAESLYAALRHLGCVGRNDFDPIACMILHGNEELANELLKRMSAEKDALSSSGDDSESDTPSESVSIFSASFHFQFAMKKSSDHPPAEMSREYLTDALSSARFPFIHLLSQTSNLRLVTNLMYMLYLTGSPKVYDRIIGQLQPNSRATQLALLQTHVLNKSFLGEYFAQLRSHEVSPYLGLMFHPFLREKTGAFASLYMATSYPDEVFTEVKQQLKHDYLCEHWETFRLCYRFQQGELCD